MICEKCGTEFQINNTTGNAIMCSKCGKLYSALGIDVSESPKEALKCIVELFSTNILDDKTRLAALLSDYIPSLDTQKNVLKTAIAQNIAIQFYKNITCERDERIIIAKKAMGILVDDAGLSEKWARFVVESFCYALSWSNVSLSEERNETRSGKVVAYEKNPSIVRKAINQYEIESRDARVVNAKEANKLKQYAYAMESLLEASNDNNSLAQMYLGLVYFRGIGTARNYDEALKYFYLSAQNDSPLGEVWYGRMYVYGYGVPKDVEHGNELIDKNKVLLEALAVCGNEEAQYLWGYECYFGDSDEKDYKKAFHWLSKATEQGECFAARLLGDCYYFGNGVSQNYKKAYETYKLAADGGSKTAYADIAECYADGLGTKKSEKDAFEYYLKAAECDIARAQFIIADYYKEGKCVESSDEKYFYWLMRAYNNGYTRAIGRTGLCYSIGIGVKADLVEADKWYEMGANLDNAFCQWRIGQKFLLGTGCEANYEEAYKWLNKSWQNGNDDAKHELGLMYYYGLHVKNDYKKAFEFFRECAEKGNKFSVRLMAECYELKRGIDDKKRARLKTIELYKKAVSMDDIIALRKCAVVDLGDENYVEAIPCLQKCVESGDGEAEVLLASCYLEGLGVKKDENKAFELFNKNDCEFFLAYCYAYGKGIEKNKEKAKKIYNGYNEEASEKNKVKMHHFYRNIAKKEFWCPFWRLLDIIWTTLLIAWPIIFTATFIIDTFISNSSNNGYKYFYYAIYPWVLLARTIEQNIGIINIVSNDFLTDMQNSMGLIRVLVEGFILYALVMIPMWLFLGFINCYMQIIEKYNGLQKEYLSKHSQDRHLYYNDRTPRTREVRYRKKLFRRIIRRIQEQKAFSLYMR